ncbi:MAG: hypothetical protein ACO3ND_07370 [Opitutales bacterium]
MNGFALTYWFTWGLLLLTSALTGVASVKDAFFAGLIASVASALLHRVFVRIGPRFAPVFGAAVGALWSSLLFLKVRWLGTPEAVALASWNLGTEIAVHAAAFAGAALFTALFARGAGLAVGAGLVLAASMSALPYGVIAAVDRQVAGPVEVLLLASAELPPHEAPPPLPGAAAVSLAPEEVSALRELYLVTDGPRGPVVQDDLGRRYWPLWRRSFAYPGNPGGPVRRLILLVPPVLPSARGWRIPGGSSPDGRTIVQLGPDAAMRIHPVASSTQSVRVDVVAEPKGLAFEVRRSSPLGDMYVPVASGPHPSAFPAPAAEAAPEGRPRPRFDADR